MQLIANYSVNYIGNLKYIIYFIWHFILFYWISSLITSNVVFALDKSGNKKSKKEIERIEITGSRIKRIDLETANPVTVFSSEDIVASGMTTLEDLIQNMSSINGSAEGSSINNGSRGFATAALRGLGAGRTLVLINGRRYASSDLNAIPTAIVDRIEITRDGASTIYGSDAIAGVINIITKKHFDGMAFQAQYSQTDKQDGETTLVAATVGTTSEKGNVFFSLQYTDRKAIYQGERDFSACPFFEANGAIICGGSGTIPYGQFVNANFNGHLKDPITGNVRPFDLATDGFNYAKESYLTTPQSVFGINASASYQIESHLTSFIEGGFINRKSNQLLAAEGTFWGPIMPANNPFNPVGEDISVFRRLQETNGRAFSQDFTDYRMVVGLEGLLLERCDWNIALNFTRFIDTRLDEGRVNPERIATLLDTTLCSNDSDCPEVWNITQAGTFTQAMMDYALIPNSPIFQSETRQFLANVSGDLGFELFADTAQFAAGYEHRTEKVKITPDGGAAIGQIFGASSESTKGEYQVDEFYAEIDLPIVSDASWFESVRVTAAMRYSDYDVLSGSEVISKFGLEWIPVEGLLVRSTFSSGFRAPSIVELYAPQTESNLKYTDPCVNYGSGNQSANVKENCQSEGLPSNFSLSTNQSSTLVGGNTNLKPEESKTFTVGFVYSQDIGVSIGLDYYRIEIINGVGTAGTDNVINACWESKNFSSPLCHLIKGPTLTNQAPHSTSKFRSALGTVSGVLLTNTNLSTFETSGYDFDVNYKTHILEGDFFASINGTYMDKYDYLPFDGADLVKIAGKVAADQWDTNLAVFKRLKISLNLNYAMNDWSVFWQTRYQSKGTDLFASNNKLDNIADDVFYHDIQGTYFIFDNTELSLGIKNLLDEEPPYISTYDDMNTIPSSYETAGRYLYVRVNIKF